MTMKKGVALLFFSLLVSGVNAQISGSNFNYKFLEANQLMEEKLWNRASDIWSQLVSEDPSNGNVNYKLGYCLLETANRKLESLKYLEQAVEAGVSENYDPYDPSEKKAPIDSRYFLSRALHLDYQMERAIINYNQLIAEIPSKHRLVSLAERQIEMCNEAIYQVANPQNYSISNADSTINSSYNDYSPVISLNEKTLFFTSRRIRVDSTNISITDDDTGENKEDIYVSYKNQDNEWQSPELLNINTDEHAASISVSPDAQTLYIYFDQGGNGDIYKSQLVGEIWTTPEPMGSDINSPAWETHITVSSDEKTLFFISDRENGYGGRDIYRCVKLPTNKWSKALNVGPELNTPYDEDAIFLSADGKTLYFSSNGHTSMGDFDIFSSSLGDDGAWSKPQNIGYPINTTDADVYFYPTADNNRAYYSSGKKGGLGLKDIYSIDLPESKIDSDLSVLKGYIYPAEGEKLPDNCLVVATNKNTGELTEYRVRQRDGSYIAILPTCETYEIEYFVNDELVEEESIDVPCESGYQTIDREIFLLPVQLSK
jgi:tetratricopeptide (TPR) repeat protein